MSDALASQRSTATVAGMPRMFAGLWLSQLLSLTGSAVTGFGISVWIYQKTGSVLDYALLLACAAVPALAAAPLAGAWVDRMERRAVMVVANAGAALCTAAIGLLLWLGRLELAWLLVINVLAAVCQAFQRPAFLAAAGMLLRKEELARASGLIQLGLAIPMLAGPLLATALLGTIGMIGIVIVDLCCFAVATGLLLGVRIPAAVQGPRPQETRRSAWKEFAEVLAFLRERPPLRLLLAYMAVQGFLTAVVTVLFTPIVLAVFSEAVLGQVLTLGGLGMLAGSLLISTWGGPRQRAVGTIAFSALLGAAVLVGGIWTSVPVLGGCAFAVMLCEPVIHGCEQTLWRHKVPRPLQGRLFALHGVLTGSALPLAALAGGLAADHWFEPWMMPDGWLADSVGLWMGVGKGRGVALMFVVVGAVTVVLALAALAYAPLRDIDRRVCDAP